MTPNIPKLTITIIALMMLMSGLALVPGGAIDSAAAWDPPANTYVWNAPSDSNFNNASNWLPLGVPSAGKNIIFNATSVNKCTWDLAITVGDISLESTYSGIVTITGVHIGYDDFTMAGGTWTADVTKNQTCSGNFLRTGGTLTNGKLNLIMTGDDKDLKVYPSNINGLHIKGYTYVASTFSVYSAKFVIDEGATLEIPAGNPVSYRYTSPSPVPVIQNNGLINGTGMFTFSTRYDMALDLGNVQLKTVAITQEAEAATARTIQLSDATLDSQVEIKNLKAGTPFNIDFGDGDHRISRLIAYSGVVLDGGNSSITITDTWETSAATWNAGNSSVTFENGNSNLDAYTYLDLPGAVAGKNIVHPDVLYFEEAWNGYHYWMVYTPFPPNTDENPWIVVSNDKMNWAAPPGLTNPVFPYPGMGDSYFADTDLLYDPETDSLSMYWLWGGGPISPRQTIVSSSTDGITWTPYVNCTMGYYPTGESPAIVKIGDLYRMWYRGGTGIILYESNDGLDWPTYQNCTITGTLPNGHSPYHLNVIYIPTQKIYLMALNIAGGIGNNMDVYLTSSDGITWTLETGPQIVEDTTTFQRTGTYRSCIFLDGSDTLINIMYGAVDPSSGYKIAYSAMEATYEDGDMILSSARIGYINSADPFKEMIIKDSIMVNSDLDIDALYVDPSATVWNSLYDVTVKDLTISSHYGSFVLTGANQYNCTVSPSTGAISTDKTTTFYVRTGVTYQYALGALTVEPSSSIDISIGYWSKTKTSHGDVVASWTATGGGMTTYEVTGLNDSTTYRILKDGVTIKTFSGGDVEFTVDSNSVYSIEVWDPYESMSAIWAILPLVILFSVIPMVMGLGKRLH